VASSELDIYNLAIAHAGVDASLTNLADKSREAELCRLFYDNVQKKVLSAAPWSEAKKTARLNLLATATDEDWIDGDPEPGWTFAYKRPNDFIYPRYTSNYGRFILGNRGGENVIYSGEEDALLTYTFQQTDVAKWSQWLIDAVSYALAASIIIPLSGKNDRAQLMYSLANQHILIAREMTANEDNQQLESLPPWLAARGASGPGFPDRYIYPVGPLLAGMTVG
jgi:hypothetical protein